MKEPNSDGNKCGPNMGENTRETQHKQILNNTSEK